jgi:hypothetical protein
MDAAAFLLSLRKRAMRSAPSLDPLADTRCFLVQYAETAEGRALRRVLQALASGSGKFVESEVWLFSRETIGLVSALVDARLGGRYEEEDWLRASR